MRLLPLALAAILLAASSPLGGRHVINNLTETVNIDIQVNKATSEATIEVWDQDRSQVLAQSCSFTSPGSMYLNHGYFSKRPITVKSRSAMTAGATSPLATRRSRFTATLRSPVASNATASSAKTRPLSAAWPPFRARLLGLSKAGRLAMQDCFPNGALKLTKVMRAAEGNHKVTPYAETLREMNIAAKMIAGSNTFTNMNDTITQRQYNPCSIWSSNTKLEGDGDPHQTPMHIQLSVSFLLLLLRPTQFG